MAKKTKKNVPTPVEAYEMQGEYKRPTLPTGEYSGIASEELMGRETPVVKYSLGDGDSPSLDDEFAARDPDLDPQYIWRGKQKNDINTLETAAPFIYQQEKIFPRMLIEEMKRQTAIRKNAADAQMTLGEGLEDFDPNARPSFYNHEEGWKNRMILGDSLQVMASLAENERLRGKVQMVYFDPPYGIKFNSNWQPSTKSTNVKDGAVSDITREPEMVKAFRDTWHDGIHSYLGYLRDRLTVARDLLAESGSVFVQIGDANVHKVRALMDEIFGEENFVRLIFFKKTTGQATKLLTISGDFVLWYAKQIDTVKYHQLFVAKDTAELDSYTYIESPDGTSWRKMTKDEVSDNSKIPNGWRIFSPQNIRSQGSTPSSTCKLVFRGKVYYCGDSNHWKTSPRGMSVLNKSGRLHFSGSSLNYKRYVRDYPVVPISEYWLDTAIAGFSDETKVYVVQTAKKVISRCLQMTTDPGDLVLDPTCGSGTTATVAEQWGRRWITIDTSRVAIALARRRVMTAKYPYYLLADSEAGLKKEMEITGKVIQRPTFNKISQGFVYERVPHITLKAIANNSEIDTIWEKYEAESLEWRKGMCPGGKIPEEWEVPFEWKENIPFDHARLEAFMNMKRKRQAEIDASIARSADTEYLYDKPYEDKKRVRVAGPFTVESIAPVRSLIAEADGALTDPALKIAKDVDYGNGANYVTRMIRTLRKNGVKQARKGDKIDFVSVEPWANGRHIAAEAWGEASETSGRSKRYAIAFGPEFGSVTRLDMKNAAREALECGFDVLVYCAFNFEAYVEEGSEQSMGRLKVLQARMNSDLHMSTDLKDTGSGNPFVIFGEPDIEVAHTEDDLYTVTIKGVDVYDPKTNEVRNDNADAIDCWMLDTDYTGEAFFARQVYFPGKDDVYKAFKAFLKNDIDEEEWESVAQTVSRPFPRPKSGQIAVKVINHFGDEVMKVFSCR